MRQRTEGDVLSLSASLQLSIDRLGPFMVKANLVICSLVAGNTISGKWALANVSP